MQHMRRVSVQKMKHMRRVSVRHDILGTDHVESQSLGIYMELTFCAKSFVECVITHDSPFDVITKVHHAAAQYFLA